MDLRMNLSERLRLSELIDDPALDPAEHRLALKGLERINRWSFAENILWNPICRFALTRKKPLRILDIACGAGDLAIGLWKRAQKAGLPVEIDGADISPVAVDSARESARRKKADVHFFELDILSGEIPPDYGVVMSSLFLHHLEREQAVLVLRRMSEAGRMILINDLIRNRLGFALAYLGSRILTRSRVVHKDSLLSVRAAFRPEEIKKLAGDAGLNGFEITRHWPCRFLLKWRRPGKLIL